MFGYTGEYLQGLQEEVFRRVPDFRLEDTKPPKEHGQDWKSFRLIEAVVSPGTTR